MNRTQPPTQNQQTPADLFANWRTARARRDYTAAARLRHELYELGYLVALDCSHLTPRASAGVAQ